MEIPDFILNSSLKFNTKATIQVYVLIFVQIIELLYFIISVVDSLGPKREIQDGHSVPDEMLRHPAEFPGVHAASDPPSPGVQRHPRLHVSPTVP